MPDNPELSSVNKVLKEHSDVAKRFVATKVNLVLHLGVPSLASWKKNHSW